MRLRAAKYDGKAFKEVNYKVGDQVMLWGTKMAKSKEN